MKIVVASKNPVKLLAVTDLIPEYPLLADASFELRPVSSDVSEQPLSLEEILKGIPKEMRNDRSSWLGVPYLAFLKSPWQ